MPPIQRGHNYTQNGTWTEVHRVSTDSHIPLHEGLGTGLFKNASKGEGETESSHSHNVCQEPSHKAVPDSDPNYPAVGCGGWVLTTDLAIRAETCSDPAGLNGLT